jgi:hypothetical protein
MAIPTVNITTTIRDHTGAAVAGAIVRAKLSAIDCYQAQYVYPVEQQYVADGAGLVTMALFPNAIGERNTFYNIKAQSADGGKTYLTTTIVVPNVNKTLDQLENSPPLDAQNTFIGGPIAMPFYDVPTGKQLSTLKNYNTAPRSYIFPDIAGTVLIAAAVLTPGLLTATDAAGTNIVGRTLQAPAAGITIANPAGIAGNPTFALANDLAAVEGIALTGLAARTAADTWTVRTLTQPAAGITISNADGVAGNPTLALANDLSALEALGSTGLAARTAADTWAQRTLTGTANQITVTNGDGVLGNPTISLPSNPIIPGLVANTMVYAGTSAALTSTAAPTNGQLLIGSTGAAPVLATLTQTANQVLVTNGAGSITLSLPAAVTMPGSLSVTTTLGVTGATTLSSALTYGGVTLANAVTGTGNMVLSASPTFSGSLGIGAAPDTRAQLAFGGSFAGSSDAYALRIVSTLSPTAGSWGLGAVISPTLNRAGSGTHTHMAGVYLGIPTIGAGAAAVTNGTTLYIDGAPSVGTNQRSLWVAAGLVEMNGNLTLGTASQVYVTNTATTPIVANTTAAGLYGYYRLDRSGAVKGYLGLTASDELSLIDASAVAQLKITSGGITITNYLGIGGNAAGTYSINAAHTGTSTTRVANSIFRGNVGTDESLKADFQEITFAAEKLLTVRAVTGIYKRDPLRRHPFLIAQDILRVQPEAVDRNLEGTLDLRYTEVMPLMVAATNEHTRQISEIRSWAEQDAKPAISLLVLNMDSMETEIAAIRRHVGMQ